MKFSGWLQLDDTLAVNLDEYARLTLVRDPGSPEGPDVVLTSRSGDERLDLYLEGAAARNLIMHVRRYCPRADAAFAPDADEGGRR